MASSLEELLAEEGFTGRRPLRKSKGSIKSYFISTSNNHSQEKRNSDSDMGAHFRTAMRPPLFRSSSSGEYRTEGRVKSLIEGDNFTNRERTDKGSSKEYMEIFCKKKEYMERLDRKGHPNVMERTQCTVNLSNDEPKNGYNIISEEGNEILEDMYSNAVHIRHGVKGEAREKERYKERSGKIVDVKKKLGNSLTKNLHGHMNFHCSDRTIKKLPERSCDKSNNSSFNRKSFEDDHRQSHDHYVEAVSVPALDVIAVQAVVSIIDGYLKHFLKDNDFRLMLRHSCFTLLNFVGDERCNTSEVISNLEQAIDVVEKAAYGLSNEKDLKKALLQLNMTAGLNTNALKDGLTSGISNSKLSACAHLYLSMIFKIQKKENSSAKHILQVFCDLPFQARTILFPDLWDNLFFPHLAHLKAWYDREANTLGDTPRQSSNMILLDEVFNEIMDSGTFKFATYYKNWLRGVEAPAPSITVPAVSFGGFDQESSLGNSTGITLPDESRSSHLMVSKKLYEAVFSSSKNPGAPDTESEWKSENLDNYVQCSNSSNVSQHTQNYFSDSVKDVYQDTDEDSTGSSMSNISPSENCKAQEWKMYDVKFLAEMDDSDEFCNSASWEKTAINIQVLHTQPHAKEYDCTGQRHARSSLTEDLRCYDPPNFREASFNSLVNPSKVISSFKEQNDTYEYFEDRFSLLSIPEDFICPLTGQSFEDPVTLETGQSFEKRAIKAWLDQGHRTCPVTGKRLETLAVPLTNFVLKRVISNWSSNRRTNLLAFLSQMVDNSGKCRIQAKNETTIIILEQFLIVCGKSEAMENAKYLITHGYLCFLIQMFELVKLEEKTRIVALLSCCIEADTFCSNQIANEISKSCLVNLLHSKRVKSLESVVQLLSKLIFLERRKDVTLFLSGLLYKDSESTLQALLVYLRNSPLEQRPLIAILLLHFNLVVGSLRDDVYMKEAVDAITNALDVSLTNEKVRESYGKAISILGGHFSLSRKFESWMLKEAGFISSCEVNSLDYIEEYPVMKNNKRISLDDDKQANEEWLKNLALSLIKTGEQALLGILFKCIASGNLDLVGLGLATLTWLSFSLPLVSASEFQPSALSTLIYLLKDSLRNSILVEHKILSSICLLNFSKISECRLLVIAMGKDIKDNLRSLAKVTKTAKQLYDIITAGDVLA